MNSERPISVSVTHGWTELHLMTLAAYSIATVLVRDLTAPLDALYATTFSLPIIPAPEEMLIIEPFFIFIEHMGQLKKNKYKYQ